MYHLLRIGNLYFGYFYTLIAEKKEIFLPSTWPRRLSENRSRSEGKLV